MVHTTQHLVAEIVKEANGCPEKVDGIAKRIAARERPNQTFPQQLDFQKELTNKAITIVQREKR